jgi:hypothetical protein
MKNFQQLAFNVDVLPLMHQIQRQPELWNENTLRTCHPGTAHSQVSDIWVWFNNLTDDVSSVVDDRETIPYKAWYRLPAVRPIVFGLMRQVEGVRLGRVLITKLPCGKEITPHVDQGAPAEYYERYQIALQSLPGALFHIEDETVNFKTGEIWHINNNARHSVVNNSADDRIALIVDIRCA